MTRLQFLLVLISTCSLAQAQDNGNPTGDGGAGGATGTTVGAGEGIETSDLGGEGLTTGPTERTTTFSAPAETGFDTGGGGQTFQARNFNGGGQNRQVITGGSSQTQRQVRPTFRLGFVPSQSLLARSRQRAVSRFTLITPRVRELRGASLVSDQNGNVTLRGQATSRYSSLVAAALARLEPGVRRVRNEVRVTPEGGRTLPPSASSPGAPVSPPSNFNRGGTVQPQTAPILSAPLPQPTRTVPQVPRSILPADPPLPTATPTPITPSPVIIPPVPPGR